MYNMDSQAVATVLAHPATWMLATVFIIAILIAINDFIRGFNNK